MGNNQSLETKKVVVVEPIAIVKQNGAVITPVAVTPAVVEPVVTPVEYSFKSFVESANNFILQVGPWIRKQKAECENSEIMKYWRQTQDNFRTEIKAPLCNLYNTIPEKFTDAKFELIGPYTSNQRFTVLNILCALTAIATITATSNVNPMTRLLRTTRNAGVMYVLGGLLIAPEIYNPLMRAN